MADLPKGLETAETISDPPKLALLGSFLTVSSAPPLVCSMAGMHKGTFFDHEIVMALITHTAVSRKGNMYHLSFLFSFVVSRSTSGLPHFSHRDDINLVSSDHSIATTWFFLDIASTMTFNRPGICLALT